MKGDGSDIYRVDWNNISAEDGDPTLGAFVFAVDPSGKSDKVTTSAPVIVQESPGVSPLVAVLIGLAGLVIGGVGGNYVANRMRGTVPRFVRPSTRLLFCLMIDEMLVGRD
jgi:hypothetical protein